MAEKKLPWFRFYAADFLVDTAYLTAEEVGVYVRLLGTQWMTGSIPADPARLARVAGIETARFEAEIWPELTPFFEPDEEDGLVNLRLERERTARDRARSRRSKAGRKGARERWSKSKGDNATGGQAIAMPMAMPSESQWPGQGESESETETETETEREVEVEREKKDQKLNYRERELRNLEIESNGFVPASDIPSVGAFLASINTAVAEREALDFEDISYTLNAFFPPERPGAGTNPAVKAWLGRIPEQTIGSALRYLHVQTYTVDGEEKTWGQLTDDHCKRLITAGLNAILRERGG